MMKWSKMNTNIGGKIIKSCGNEYKSMQMSKTLIGTSERVHLLIHFNVTLQILEKLYFL